MLDVDLYIQKFSVYKDGMYPWDKYFKNYEYTYFYILMKEDLE